MTDLRTAARADEAKATAERDALKAQNERLQEALRHVSLCSQNSMSSKEECGQIARAALRHADVGTAQGGGND